MELMQTGRRRWGRPTRARSPTRGRRGYAQALGTFATARHILGGGPVRTRDILPRCYPSKFG